jgi:YHS domain-containing protein
MKKNILNTISSITIFLFLVGCSQAGDHNLKGGYAAEGYDVVAYFSKTAVKGNAKFATTHKGAGYKFSSLENLEKFKKSPDTYAPQYGGWCAYAIALKSKKVGIDPKTYEIRGGKLYLFYNSWGTDTLKLWLKEKPAKLKIAADKNWAKITRN